MVPSTMANNKSKLNSSKTSKEGIQLDYRPLTITPAGDYEELELVMQKGLRREGNIQKRKETIMPSLPPFGGPLSPYSSPYSSSHKIPQVGVSYSHPFATPHLFVFSILIATCPSFITISLVSPFFFLLAAIFSSLVFCCVTRVAYV